jgi:cell division protein FtsA
MPTARQEISVSVLDGKVFAIAGYDANGQSTATVEIYDPRTNAWQKAASLPIATNHNAAATVNGQLYAFGGTSPRAFVYDAGRDAWTEVASMRHVHGGTPAVAVIGGKIYVAGGTGADMVGNELEVYDPGADKWQAPTPMEVTRNHTAGGVIADLNPQSVFMQGVFIAGKLCYEMAGWGFFAHPIESLLGFFVAAGIIVCYLLIAGQLLLTLIESYIVCGAGVFMLGFGGWHGTSEIASRYISYIVGVGTSPSRGLRKGVVVDIDATVDSIRKAVDEAEMMAGCEISSVYAGIAGGHIQAHNEIGMIAIKDREVRLADVKRVIEQAQAIAIPADREVIHVIPQEYELDGQDGIKHPVGMSGVRLIAKVHIVTAAVTSAQNVIKSANKAGLNVIDIVLEPLASAEAVLAPDEKELGVALIDLGGGTTDLAVFADGSIKHTAVLSLGGYHLTNDAAVGLRTPFDQAERIKRRFGCAAARYLPREELLTVPSVGGRAPREVSRKMLSEFLEPRMEEILSLVREELARAGHLDKIPSGIVVTGGTSALEGLPELAEEIFELPVRRGTPRGIGGLVDRVAGPEFSTAVGLAIYGSKRVGKPRFRIYDGSSFRKVRSRMREWFYGEMR